MEDTTMEELDTTLSWITMNDNQDRWIVNDLPPTTEEGKHLISKSKIPDSILVEEWREIENKLDEIGTEWDVKLEDISNIVKMTNKTRALFGKKRNNRKEKGEKITLARLAATRPEGIQEVIQEEGATYLSISKITNMWVSVIEVLGFLEEETTPICYDGSVIPLTEEGHKIKNQHITGLTESELKEEEIMKEGDEGIHDICARAIQTKMIDNENVEELAISLKAMWLNNDRSKEQNRLMAAAIRLAKSPPKVIPGWNGKIIYSNQIARLWTAANVVFGSVWWEMDNTIRPTNLADDMDFTMEEGESADNTGSEQDSRGSVSSTGSMVEEEKGNMKSPPSILRQSSSYKTTEGSPPKNLKQESTLIPQNKIEQGLKRIPTPTSAESNHLP